LSSSAIANQESLSGLETEMRKLEGIVKEVVDELEYLKQREERFSDTNRQSYLRILVHRMLLTLSSLQW
jgi:plasmid replication initiation protein